MDRGPGQACWCGVELFGRYLEGARQRGGCVVGRGGVRALETTGKEMSGVTESAGHTVVLEVAEPHWVIQRNEVETVVDRRWRLIDVVADPVAQMATLIQDPARTSVSERRRWVRACRYHGRGARSPITSMPQPPRLLPRPSDLTAVNRSRSRLTQRTGDTAWQQSDDQGEGGTRARACSPAVGKPGLGPGRAMLFTNTTAIETSTRVGVVIVDGTDMVTLVAPKDTALVVDAARRDVEGFSGVPQRGGVCTVNDPGVAVGTTCVMGDEPGEPGPRGVTHRDRAVDRGTVGCQHGVRSGVARRAGSHGQGADGCWCTGGDGRRRRQRRCGTLPGGPGIAIGAGTDVVVATADVVLMRSDSFGVAVALRIGRGALRTTWQKRGWAAGYNVLTVPVAAGVFEPPFALVLRPEIAAITAAGSSALVAVNALTLNWLKFPDPTPAEMVPTRAPFDRRLLGHHGGVWTPR